MAKRKKKKVPLRTQIRRLKIKADKALSEYVRKATIARYKLCPLCGIEPVQHNFHFITRKRPILRWCIQNCVGSCKKCNLIENFWPDLSRAWYIRENGAEAYLSLVDESRKSFTPTIEYLENIIATFKDKLLKL